MLNVIEVDELRLARSAAKLDDNTGTDMGNKLKLDLFASRLAVDGVDSPTNLKVKIK